MKELGILLQIPAEGADGGEGMMTQILMFGAIFLVFYLFMIRQVLILTQLLILIFQI